MNDTGDANPHGQRNLADTIRKVRTAETERSDVVVELRDAERGRLEILADELKGVFEEVPAEDEQFLFTIAGGLPPRLWIDMTSFVVMGRDRRTYRFLKDTRLGRTVLRESADLDEVADTITHYVAERIIERERALEGDWLVRHAMQEQSTRKREARALVAEAVQRTVYAPVEPVRGIFRTHLGWFVATFLAGLLVGAAVLFGTAWFAVG